MLDRKLLVEALRVDNKDVLPKFGSPELRKIMEAATEYISIDNIMDYEEGKVTDDGIYSIMDALDRGSVGIADSDGQPALNFMKSGTEIYAHNMFTDEDEVLDATAVALSEYIMDQLETQTFDTNEAATEDATNVIFKREPNEYTDEVDILAVFPDEIEQAGDEGRVLVYSHVGQHSYASPFYIEELEDATPEEYEDLKEELEGQGYQLNVLNGLDQDLPEEAEVPEVNSTLSEEITSLKQAKRKSRKNEVSDELKNKVAARRQIDAEIANDAENEILVKHGRKSKEYKKAHAKTKAAIDKLNKFGRSSHDIIKSKEYQAMDDGKYAAPGIVRKNENSYDELKVLKGPENTMNVHLRNGKFIGLHIFRNADSHTIYQITPDEIKSGFHEIRDGEETAQEYIDRIAKRFDVPTYKLESAQKSEALSLDELLNMYKEEIDEAKARLDKCYERVAYRLKENVSYSPEQATPIIANLAIDVRTKSSDVVDEVYRKLG